MAQSAWVQQQLREIDAAGDTRAVAIDGREVVVMHQTGAVTGSLRRVPVMRVEHDGVFLAVGSAGGADDDPQWVANLRAHPDIALMDRTDTFDVQVREITDQGEYEQWWERAVAAFPTYADYRTRTQRHIPIFAMAPRS